MLTRLLELEASEGGDLIDAALETVRRHFGMEIAYLSEFVDGRTVFRAVSAPGLEALIKPGDSRSLEETYCRHIVEGRLPGVIRDTGELSFAQGLPITHEVPIGSHVSVPVRRADGSVYGTFCCLSPRPNLGLTDRDLSVMELFAEVSARELNRGLAQRSRREEIATRTRAAIAERGIRIQFQPIVDLATGVPAGFEALSRFTAEPARTPDIWFNEAAELGLAPELEVAAIACALDLIDLVPAGMYLSLNASPATVISDALAEVLAGQDLSRLVLEVTEHAAIADIDLLRDRIAGLRAGGLRLAVDDAGAGYAGLQQILRLRPDLIKLDMSLTRGIDSDPAQLALAAAMQGFAVQTGARLIAEGIETEAERAALFGLGVGLGQGYLLGRPRPAEEAIDAPAAAQPAAAPAGCLSGDGPAGVMAAAPGIG